MASENVVYNKEEILKILRDLDLLVVSSDRIGAAYYDRASEEQYNAMFVRFFDELGFFRKLASARRVLSRPFPDDLGEDGKDELERNADGLRYWPDHDPADRNP